MRQTYDLINGKDSEAVQGGFEALVGQLSRTVSSRLRKTLQLSWTSEAEKELKTILREALTIIRTLHNHTASFRMTMLDAITKNKATGVSGKRTFDPEIMQELSDCEDEDVLTGMPLAASVFPLVYRCGDDAGNYVSQGA